MPPIKPMVRNAVPAPVWLLPVVRRVVRAALARTSETALSAPEEFQQAASFGTDERALLQRQRRGLAQVAHRGTERAEGTLDFIHYRRCKTAPPQSHDVQADHGIAFRRHAERRDVERDARAAADHGALADAAELVDHGSAAQEGAIADLHVPGQQHRVGDHYAAAYAAIMRHVACGHQEAIRTNLSGRTRPGGATDRHVFPDDGAGPDAHAGLRGCIEAQVLRIAADDGEGVNYYRLAEFAMPRDHCVGVDYAAAAEAGTILYQRRRMYLHR